MDESADCRTVFTDKSRGDSRLTTIVGTLAPLIWLVEDKFVVPEELVGLGIFKVLELEPPRNVKCIFVPGLLVVLLFNVRPGPDLGDEDDDGVRRVGEPVLYI